MKISDPLTGEHVARDPVTKVITTVKMDPLMPRQPKNRLPFDDPEAEWMDEPSDEESGPVDEPEHGGSGTDDQPEGGNTTLTQRWVNEFDSAEGRDLDWRIDQHREWDDNGADGYDNYFGHSLLRKSS